MANKLFGLPQVRQLEEIQNARLKAGGDGIHADVQELIDRLTAGGVGTPATNDPFLVQTKVLWDAGWGRELGCTTLDAYQKSVKKLCAITPERPAGMPAHLNRCILWDRRPVLVGEEGSECVSITKLCRLLGVIYNGDDDTLVQHERTPLITAPVMWVWCQDGRMNRNRKPSDCRASFSGGEVGLEAEGGLFLFAQDRTILEDHFVDLPGSVHRDGRSYCAYLKQWGDRPKLDWYWGGFADPQYGSASRWECPQ